MCNGGRNWYGYVIISNSKESLERFIQLYDDVMIQCKYHNVKCYLDYSDYYGGWKLKFWMTPEDMKGIVTELNLEKHKLTRRGQPTYCMKGD